MGSVARLGGGVAGTLLAAVVAFAQAPAGDGAQAPAPAAQQPAGGQAGGRQGQRQGGQGAQPQGAQPGGQQDGQAAGQGRGGRGGGGRGGARGGDAAGGASATSFFVTSVGKGDGGNLGGLEGADAHCAQLAKAAGIVPSAGRTWRAYLSASATAGHPAVNARDRIGPGPWSNAKGVVIAANVADLHGDIERDRNQLAKATALTEKGTVVNGIGDVPVQHDILTGSNSSGRAVAGTTDTTCNNWTSNAPAPASGGDGRRGGAAGGSTALGPANPGPGVNVGHSDRQGDGNTSWNFARRSRGCSQAEFEANGGAGLFYCFLTN